MQLLGLNNWQTSDFAYFSAKTWIQYFSITEFSKLHAGSKVMEGCICLTVFDHVFC